MTRFMYRHVNQITGVFVLLALLLAGLGIYMAGRAQHWFEPTEDVTLLLPEEGSFGLTPGGVVVIRGTDAGEITQISVRDDGRMTATATVRGSFVQFIRASSVATIKKTFAMAGDSFIEMSGGGGGPLAPGALIEVVVDRAPTDLFQDVISQIGTEVLPAIKEIRLAFEKYGELASDIDGPVVKALNRIETIGASIEEGDGLLPRMLTDKKMADDVSGVIGRINGTLDETHAAARDLRAVIAQLGTSAGKLHEAIEQLPGTVRQVNTTLEGVREVTDNLVRVTGALPATLRTVDETVESIAVLVARTQATFRETQRLVEGAQRHWLVRGYIRQDKPAGRIAPKDVVTEP
jgi:phospholipid/cholesterol/gamma-HCH transport system substrate-binding protein